ncbi:aldehyde dehydrogenase family protein, partial [Halalkalibacter alkalisediminis]
MQNYEELNKSFINGQWVKGDSERSYDIVNPYDNSLITTFQLATSKQVEEAFDVAKAAQKQWAKSTVEERREVLHKAADYLKEHREEIVSVIGRETGG